MIFSQHGRSRPGSCTHLTPPIDEVAPFRHGDCVWIPDEGGWKHRPANVPGAAGDIALLNGQHDGRRGHWRPDRFRTGFQRSVYEQGWREGAGANVEPPSARARQQNPYGFSAPNQFSYTPGAPWGYGLLTGCQSPCTMGGGVIPNFPGTCGWNYYRPWPWYGGRYPSYGYGGYYPRMFNPSVPESTTMGRSVGLVYNTVIVSGERPR